MTRIVVLPADQTGCGTYRMYWPAQVVKQMRPDWVVEVYEPAGIQVATDQNGRLTRLKGIDNPGDIDLVVMQRVGIPAALQLMEWFKRQGTAIVVDSDDAMWAIDQDNIAFRAWNGGAYHWKYLDKACEIADVVTVTTERLARRYGKHGRVEVLPNCIPTASLSLESRRDEYDQTVAVGWSGFTGTHPHDLETCGDAISRLVNDTGCSVRVVGDAQGAETEWKLPDGSIDRIPPAKLGVGYYSALTTFDIGVVPLRDTHFNHAKSWLKALEFSAMGLPVVATPTEDNRRLSKTVPILLADSPAEWYQHLERLVTNPEERDLRASEAKEAVRVHHTFESQGERWMRAWERALKRRRLLSA